LEESSSNDDIESKYINEIIISAGDIVLFDRPCFQMPPLASCICIAAKVSALNQYDHIGLVVECTEHDNEKYKYGQLYLLEANIGGVTMYPLQERISKSKAKQIAFRKLKEKGNDNINIDTRMQLWRIAKNAVGSKYNSSTIDMTIALLTSYTSHGINSKLNRLKEIDDIIELLESGKYINPYLEKLVHLRKEQLQNERISIPKVLTNNQQQTNKQMSKYFCSSLVSEVLTSSDIKEDDRRSNFLIPADFSSHSYIKGFQTKQMFTYENNISLLKKDINTFKKDGGVLKMYYDTKKTDKARTQNDNEKLIIKQVMLGILTACPTNNYHVAVVNSKTKLSHKSLSCALQINGSLKLDEIEKLNVDEVINEKNVIINTGLILFAMKKLSKR